MSKILVIDDDIEILNLIKKALSDAGHQVDTCENGSDVMRAIRDTNPDLLLLDVMLPGVDGFSLANRVRVSPETVNLPIIIISALGPSRPLFESMPQVKAFFPKPFDVNDLTDKVNEILTGG
ncbi:MAG: response regulator [Elusimicrobia bacterium]|nr:response regulator [Elusimicrobiota bacterium]